MSYLKNFIKEGFTYSGRANKKDFWITVVYVAFISVVLSFLVLFTNFLPDSIQKIASIIIYTITFIWALIVIVCGWALANRRLHDANHSGGWLALAFFVPIFWIVVIVFCFENSIYENNNYIK